MTAMTATAHDLLATPDHPHRAGSTTHHYTKEHKMLSSAEIVKAVTSTPSGGSAGSLAFLAHREKGKATVKQSAFLKDAQQQRPVGAAPTAQTYQHPGSLAYRTKPRPDGALTAVEMAWLQRLPDDPTKTNFDDAAALGQLAAGVSKMQHPVDARLVGSYWQPVADHHDAAEAEVALSNARSTSLPTPPSSTMSALVEAVAHEHPELSAGEAAGRATTMLDQAVTKRADSRAQAIADAKDKLAALGDAARARGATTR